MKSLKGRSTPFSFVWRKRISRDRKEKSELGPPRKFYTLSPAGEEELAIFGSAGILFKEKSCKLKEGKRNV